MIRLFRFLPRRWWSIRGWKTWWSYIKWRMETYGVYHSGKFEWKYFWKMMKQFPTYYKWIGEMDSLRRKR